MLHVSCYTFVLLLTNKGLRPPNVGESLYVKSFFFAFWAKNQFFLVLQNPRGKSLPDSFLSHFPRGASHKIPPQPEFRPTSARPSWLGVASTKKKESFSMEPCLSATPTPFSGLSRLFFPSPQRVFLSIRPRAETPARWQSYLASPSLNLGPLQILKSVHFGRGEQRELLPLAPFLMTLWVFFCLVLAGTLHQIHPHFSAQWVPSPDISALGVLLLSFPPPRPAFWRQPPIKKQKGNTSVPPVGGTYLCPDCDLPSSQCSALLTSRCFRFLLHTPVTPQ